MIEEDIGASSGSIGAETKGFEMTRNSQMVALAGEKTVEESNADLKQTFVLYGPVIGESEEALDATFDAVNVFNVMLYQESHPYIKAKKEEQTHV